MDLEQICVCLIQDGHSLSRIRRALNYTLTEEMSSMLKKVIHEHATETFRNENRDIYRVVDMGWETRLEYIEGTPYPDVPFKWNTPITSVDFFFNTEKKNYLESFHVRKGDLRYRFHEDNRVYIMEDVFIVPEVFDTCDSIKIQVPDDSGTILTVKPDGSYTARVEPFEIKTSTHGAIGLAGDRLLFRHHRVV